MLRILTAGESHGEGLVGVLEGMPAGLPLSSADISPLLKRRKGGYGRSERMKREKEDIRIISGVHQGKTTGAPISLFIPNLSQEIKSSPTIPRPGHADLAGFLKYDFPNLIPVGERSSARETAIRTALGAVTKKFLSELDIKILGYVVSVGGRWVEEIPKKPEELEAKILSSIFYLPQPELDEEIKILVDQAKEEGETLGGVFEVRTFGVPPGLGSYVHWDRKLDSRFAAAIMSINGIKAVEVGEGVRGAELKGSEFQDEIFLGKGIERKTNRAGGIEGGVSNGEEIVIRGYMKPIPTLGNPLRSVELRGLKSTKAPYIRSDILAVPAASVIAEAFASLVLADAFLEKFGGDTLEDIRQNYGNYKGRIEKFWRR